MHNNLNKFKLQDYILESWETKNRLGGSLFPERPHMLYKNLQTVFNSGGRMVERTQ
jgi:hypothetical protein